ncbi:AzlC family ABC transporter permease [Endozoicomonas sp. SM1973]|uniref:AzlC family ABC transporter permease n=1 Tax=Spartinivicinus marinus TaxID=2994442 RepID=A0A853I9F6_9GAMM|nr:AzlC family ABC transporter permease [Spartinivicinus marinus]MCX4029197.1 AzlC family ABC transporter permease [Spartinivicinus marinus]NYZ65895.1 AzlC family ABC transporter permease [Spartinivicinus marinus]
MQEVIFNKFNHPARLAFFAGAKQTIPLLIGAIPFGIIYGTLAINQGLSPLATLAMSIFVYAGSSQFIAVGLLAAGTSIPIIILTTFIVNLRHMLYAVTLLPFVKSLPQKWRALLAFGLTDETFAVAAKRYFDDQKKNHSPIAGHWFYLGSMTAMYLNWALCTLIGITVGKSLPDMQNWGLDFAMYVTFIGMVVPYLVKRPQWAAVVSAGLVAVVAHSLPHKAGLIIAALTGVIVGVLCERFICPNSKEAK